MERIKADLHVHSNVSDCSMDRHEILELAVREEITHLSFTEHDTTLKSEECEELERQYGICLIKGIEISAFDFQTGKKAHILGYDYQTTQHIENLCKPILLRRHENCIKQIEILNTLGYQIRVEDVLPFAPYGTIYKQHILDYLVQSGQSETLFGKVYQEIFKNQGPCDFDITYVAAEDAVSAIIKDGGVAVLAHPMQQENLNLVLSLVKKGLQGLEYDHVSVANNPMAKTQIMDCARINDLHLTGGSDFHGRYESVHTSLGSCLAEEKIVKKLSKSSK